MLAAVPDRAQTEDLSNWLLGNGLEIVLIVIGAVLIARLLEWSSNHLASGLDRRSNATDGLVRSEASKYHRALAQVLTWVLIVVVYIVAAFMVIVRLGVPLTGFVAPATVVGVALGFGAQRIVQDLLAGFFVIAEKQYGFGDMVRLAVVGVASPVMGTVEDVTLRITTVRTVQGEVVITPNGQIVQVTNFSRDWARTVIDVPVPAGVDVAQVSELLQNVGKAAYDDPALKAQLLDTPTVMGVESIEVDELLIRVVARTLPGRQFQVGRILRSRIAAALRNAGIVVDKKPTVTSDSDVMGGNQDA